MRKTPDMLEDIVMALAAPHRDPVTRTRQAGLLTRLREAIPSNLGQTHSGHSAPFERSPLDLGAYMLYEEIRRQIAGLYEMATDRAPSASPEANLLGWFREFDAARARGETNDAQYRRAVARALGWQVRIETMFEPPIVKELLAECPQCGQRYVQDDLARRSALFAQARNGVVEALCRACGTRWRGEAELVILGRQIGASSPLRETT